jgi:DNA-binding IclR family transcriptional regulator
VLTPYSIRTGKAFKEELRRIREQGFAFEDEESTVGVVCLAVPVPTRGAHGPNLGVSVTALKATFTEEQKTAMVAELKQLARALGNPMG